MNNLQHIENNNIENIGYNYIIDNFNAFLNSLSPTTAINYEGDLKLYFKVIFNKKPETVTLEDIEQTTSLHASRYYSYLKTEGNMGEGYKTASIKRKIRSVKKFYDFLRVDYVNVNNFIFNNLDINKKKILDSTPYGNLSWEETLAFENYALEQQLSGNEMHYLIKLARITSIRLQSLLDLSWEKHFYKSEEGDNIVDYIKTIDKGESQEKAISTELYNELKENLPPTGKLFRKLHRHLVGEYIQEMVNHFNIDERRNIKFHSIKKTGVNRVLELTGDLRKAKEQGNHKSIVTTDEYYLKVNKKFSNQASYTLDKDIDANKEFSKFTYEELLNGILNISDMAKFELLRALQANNKELELNGKN